MVYFSGGDSVVLGQQDAASLQKHMPGALTSRLTVVAAVFVVCDHCSGRADLVCRSMALLRTRPKLH